MRTFIRKALENLGILEHIQYNQLYRKARSKSYKEYYDRQLAFYKKVLGTDNNLFFDIGANIGDHTKMLSNLSRKTVTLEPDKKNFHILSTRFSGNSRVQLVNKAVSNQSGEATFYIEEEGSAFNTLSDKWVNVLENEDESRFNKKAFKKSYVVKTVTLDELIGEYGKPDFVKIDVEGFEKEVIEGNNIPISKLCIECNLPEFLDETVFIIEHLHKLNPAYKFNCSNEYRFFLDEFVNCEEIINYIKSGELRFFELYCIVK
jgi:FkbM family methyltransferase